MRRSRFVLALLAALVLAAPPAAATNYGVFVDGSYSDQATDTEMDRLIDRRLADSDRIMGQRDPQSQRRTVRNKEELQNHLRTIRCGCDDTLTVVLMGHGTRDHFIFSKASRRRDRRLDAEDLADWLEGAAVECCCKIHVVIFSCHSGSFLDELFAKEHVSSVYASSQDDERSYSDAHWLEDGSLHDGGDWMRGFNEDWRSAPAGAALADALQASSESAEEKMPERFLGNQTPVGWRRGRLRVVAHVERPPRRDKLKIHYYQPEFMRCRTRDLEVKDIALPQNLEASNWVSFTGEFGKPDEEIKAASGLSRTEAPSETILAHVEGAGGGRRNPYLKVHTVRPKWLHCEKQRLYLDDTGQVPRNLRRCNWIEEVVSIRDPGETLGTDEALERASPVFPAKVHVSGTINHQQGTFRGHILEPRWLRCRNYDIQLPPQERRVLRSLRRCRNVLLDVDLTSVAERTLPGRNLRLIHRTQGSWEPATDVALHSPSPLDFSTGLIDTGEDRILVPRVGVTNVGQDAASFSVGGIIGHGEDAETLRRWLQDPGTPVDALWTGETRVEGLQPAETASVELDPWSVPEEGGDYWIGFRTDLPGDENPATDSSELAFELPPISEVTIPLSKEPDDDLQLVDLGALAPGRYNFPITARNASCKGQHTAVVSFWPETPAVEVSWLQIVGPVTLEKIPMGAEKSTKAVIDLRDLEPGTYSGILEIECTTCPPPPICVQDFAAVRIQAVVRQP